MSEAHRNAYLEFHERAMETPSIVRLSNSKDSKTYDTGKITDFENLSWNDLQDPKNEWKISESGANGAMKVTGDTLPYGGVVVKLELKGNAEVISDISNYVNAVRQKLPGDLPIEGMVVGPMQLKQSDLGNVFKLVDEKGKPGGNDEGRMRVLKTNLTNVENGQHVMMKAMYISDATDIDKLPITTKVRLLESNEFPSSLGQAMILGSMFGLGDHIGIKHSDSDPFTNMSNLMIKHDTGKLVFIDYGPYLDPQTRDVGRSSKTMIEDFGAVVSLAKQIAKDPKNIADTCSNGALGSVLNEILKASTQGSFFHSDEVAILDTLKIELKDKVAVNILSGAIESLLLIAENPEAFKSGKPMFDEPTKVVDFVTNMKTELGNLKKALSKLV
jgi:hypothetical protein